MNMTTWVTVSQASDILGMSERSVRRHVSDGKVASKIEGNRRLVKIETADDSDVIPVMTSSDKDAIIGWLKNELEQKNKQINHLHDEIKQNSERSDAIVMKLMDELEAQRISLTDRQFKKKIDRTFWKRLGRRKVTP